MKTMMGEMMHDKWHWHRHFSRMLGKLLWSLAVLALLLAWYATWTGSAFGLEAEHWFWDALVLGVLAIPLKLKGGHHMGGEHACSSCVPEEK